MFQRKILVTVSWMSLNVVKTPLWRHPKTNYWLTEARPFNAHVISHPYVTTTPSHNHPPQARGNWVRQTPGRITPDGQASPVAVPRIPPQSPSSKICSLVFILVLIAVLALIGTPIDRYYVLANLKGKEQKQVSLFNIFHTISHFS